MDYKSKIKELREIIPIPMSEALKLLKENNGNIDTCVEIFKTASIQYICKETGCSQEMAQTYYEREKFDLNRTVSMIREDLYDQNYKPIEGVTAENLTKVRTWIAFAEEKDFATSIDYKELPDVIKTMLLIPALKHFGIAVQQARKIKDTIFDGYSDDLSIDEFVRRNVRLDDHSEFRKIYKTIVLSFTVMKDEVIRHRRNVR